MQIGPDALDAAIDFWPSRLTRAMADSVAESFRVAVLSLLHDEPATTRLSTLDVVPPSDIARLKSWNSAIPPPVAARIHDEVYRQSLLRPDAPAIDGWDGVLTYRQLDDLATRLASHLRALHVGRDVKVPMVFEKSKWAIVAQLAILKAGGCVVPLGVNQPCSRTDMILRDIEAFVLLADAKNAARFSGALPHVVAISQDFMDKLSPPPSPPGDETPRGGEAEATPDSAAFIIYTSSSTGVPKGVVLTHSSLCTSLHFLARRFRVDHSVRMVQFSAYTSNISIQDIYTTLQSGGCLVVVSEDDRVADLAGAMRRHAVTCAGLTSTVAGLLRPADVLPSLRTLILLGEAVKPAVAAEWLPHVAVFNAYGSSECSIQASVNELTRGGEALNIGFPLAGALWVVDAGDWNRLIPVGAPGELLIEGPLLARDYLNDAAKTDAVFVHDPAWMSRHGFGGAEKRRLYRTGDLVRQNPDDGSITYLGRRDTQIKVRGQRVEVGEIEHHLAQHDDVLDAAVVFPRRGPCGGRLVGLVTLRGFLTPGWGKSDVVAVSTDGLPTAMARARELSGYLSSRVPEHMIPRVWIPLASMMPQDDSGRLDRKRLGIWTEEMPTDLYEALSSSPSPSPSSSSDPSGGQPEAETESERQMREIWARVLKVPVPQIPLRDSSFMACGGDSIAAMQVVSQCRVQGIAVGVRDVLQSKSIAQLVSLGTTDAGPAREALSPVTVPSGLTPEKARVLSEALPKLGLHVDDVQDVYPCSPIQQGILVSQAKCPSAYLIQQCFEVRPLGPSASPPSAKGIAEAWQTLVDRHSILRTVFIPAVSDTEHGLYDQLVLKRCHHHHQGKIHQLQCGDDEIESRLAIKTDISVGGTAEPDHELTVYSTPSDRVYAQLVISHALVDGSSLGILQSELIQAYDGTLTSKGPAPSYGAYVSYLQQTPASDSVRYWSGKLAGAEPCHLPPLTDSGFRHEAPSDPGRRRPLQIATRDLDTPAVLNIQALAKTHGITAATVFQLAWALVLAQYTGSQDVSFGYPTSGRDAPIDGVDDLVGPLINIVVARTQLDSELLLGQSTKQALQRVQADFLDGLGHQRAALADVLHALRLEGQSLFNTTLSYRHAPPETADGASIALDLVTAEDPNEYDANVHVLASGDKIQVMLRCSPLFMSADGASRALGSLLNAVRSVLDSLDAPLGSIRVAAEDDVARMCKWNATPDPEQTGQLDCIHHLVHAQRLSQPDATAICAWDGDMTYQELEDAADRLARHLSEDLGVGPEVMVALCIDKSRWAVVAQLAGKHFPLNTHVLSFQPLD